MNFLNSKIIKSKDFHVFATFLALTVLWVGYAGKEIGWDVLNHHIYLPYAWFSGRIHNDFFAVGPQSYQNPLGYMPFYLLIAGRLPAWGVGLCLAFLHTFNTWICWRLANHLWSDWGGRALWTWSAALLAWVTPVFLQTAGTSSVDPVGSIMVLAALYGMLPDERGGAFKRWGVFLAGVSLAIAFSIKQSNAIFIVAGGVMLLWLVLSGYAGKMSIVKHAAGLFTGLILGMGWYSWVLWKRFGNPIFPLFNNIFKSPYAVQDAGLSNRFVPSGWLEWLVRPLRMLEVKAYVYTELFAPDGRILLLAVLLLVLAAIWLLKCLGTRSVAFHKVRGWTASDSAIWVFFIIAYLLWLLTSGNGRYAIALLMVAGLLLARLIYLLFPGSMARIIVVVIIPVQFLAFLYAGQFRYEPQPWGSQEYSIFKMPEALRNEEFLNIVVGVQTYGAMVPYLSRSGVSTNPVGQFALGGDVATRKVLDDLFAQWEGRTRVLLNPTPSLVDRISDDDKSTYENLLSRLRLRVDWEDCKKIERMSMKGKNGIFANYPWSGADQVLDEYIISCKSDRHAEGISSATEKDAAFANEIYEIIEKKCPEIYGRSGIMAESFGPGRWIKRYPAKDMLVRIYPGGVTIQYARGMDIINLGVPGNIIKNGVALDCKSQSFEAVSYK